MAGTPFLKQETRNLLQRLSGLRMVIIRPQAGRLALVNLRNIASRLK